jgi:hypothetical protein
VFSYYPDANWLASSTLLSCGQPTASKAVAESDAGAKAAVAQATTRAGAP